MAINKIIFYIGALILIIGIIISFLYARNYLFYSPSEEKGMSLPFKSITIQDNYNSTFHVDVTFNTESPDFLVGEKIHVHAVLNRIHNNSLLPLSSVFFALITTEGHYMPFQGGHMYGKAMDKPLFDEHLDYYWIDYNTYLNFSAKYSCRFILWYFNITKMELEKDEIFIGPLLEVEPSSVGVQLRMEASQSQATNTSLGFASLVIMLTLINILILWIDKYEKLIFKLDSFFNRHKYEKSKQKYLKNKEIKQKEKNQNIESWENNPAFVKYK
jgi:hypothetical protein